MLGALSRYISDPGVKGFQPMGANFGILPGLETRVRDKEMRYGALGKRAIEAMEEVLP
jgi:methylenetetrahydrofolate--tRNA-(uracil-5-)-methyltransferase